MKKIIKIDEIDLQRLEFTVDELIKMCERLHDENTRLRKEQMRLVSERGDLVKRNQSSKSKMEAIITRLKTMELEI